MLYLIALIVACMVLVHLENPKRMHEASRRACVMACIKRTPHAYRRGYMVQRPPYHYYY